MAYGVEIGFCGSPVKVKCKAHLAEEVGVVQDCVHACIGTC